MNPWLRPEREAEWRAAMLSGVAMVFLESTTLFVDIQFAGTIPILAVRSAHIVLCTLVVLVLVARRRSASAAFSRAMFLIIWLPMFAVFWVAHAERTRVGVTTGLFVGQKLGMLALAATTPIRLGLGLALIGGFVIEAAVQALSFGRQAIPGEPGFSVAVGIVAAALCVNRARCRAAERRAARLSAEADVLARVARTILAVSDLANTPLQTLEMSLVLMRAKSRDVEPMLGRMDRALSRLRELRKLLSKYEQQCGVGDEAIPSTEILSGEESVARRTDPETYGADP